MEALLETLLVGGNIALSFAVAVVIYQWRQIASMQERFDALLDKMLSRDEARLAVATKQTEAISELTNLIRSLPQPQERRR